MFGSVVHAAAAPYGFERLRLNHIFSVEAEDFSQALTEFAKRVLQDVLAAVEPSATGDFLFQVMAIVLDFILLCFFSFLFSAVALFTGPILLVLNK